jgi:hypothetical protein
MFTLTCDIMSFTPRPFTQEKKLQFSLYRMLGGTYRRSTQFEEEKSIWPENETRLLSRSQLTVSNRGDSSASTFKSSLNGGSLPTDSFLHRLRTVLTWFPQLSSLQPIGTARADNTVYSRILFPRDRVYGAVPQQRTSILTS